MTDHIDHDSIKLTRAVNALFALTSDAYQQEFGSDKSHKREFVRRVAEKYAALIGCKVVDAAETKPPRASPRQPPATANPKPVGKVRVATSNQLIEEATELAEQIIELAESPDLPPAGIDYAESVADKARDIIESIEESNRASSGQVAALQNMLLGLERWF